MSEGDIFKISGKKGDILRETQDTVGELWSVVTACSTGKLLTPPLNIISIVCGDIMLNLKELTEEITKEEKLNDKNK